MIKKIWFIALFVLVVGCAVVKERNNESAPLTTENNQTLEIQKNKNCILNYEIGNVSFELINDTNTQWSCIGIFKIPIRNNGNEKITFELGLWLTRYLVETYEIPWYYWERHFKVGGSNPDSIILSAKKIEVEANSTNSLELNYIFDYCNVEKGVKIEYGIVYGKENPKQEIICY